MSRVATVANKELPGFAMTATDPPSFPFLLGTSLAVQLGCSTEVTPVQMVTALMNVTVQTCSATVPNARASFSHRNDIW
jgi:hypothetical protein